MCLKQTNQVLNRDTWSNKVLQRFVGDNFVFLQPLLSSEIGRWYAQFYKIELYPHIALLDPSTKARVKVREG